MWSLGNETARPYKLDDGNYVFRDAMRYFKEEDPTRPVLFESFGPDMGGDLHGEQYTGVDGIKVLCRRRQDSLRSDRVCSLDGQSRPDTFPTTGMSSAPQTTWPAPLSGTG